MDLMQLKAPPDKVAKMADAVEFQIMSAPAGQDMTDLVEILTWLRFRLAKWAAEHPAAPAA